MAFIDEVQTAAAASAAGKERLSNRVAPWFLLFVVAGYLTLSLVYAAITPPFEGPDEPQHFAYIQWLVRTNSLPPQGDEAWETGIEQESSQPPFYYFIASLPARVVGLDDPEVVFRPNPNFVGPIPRDFPDNDNRAIHYPGDVNRLAGGWLSFYLARGVSALFGGLLLIALYRLGRTIFPTRPRIPVLSTLLVAFLPQVIFLGGVVSNDIPVAALSTVSLWLLAGLLRHGFSKQRAVALGVAMGLATLTKVSAGILVVPVGLGLLWMWRSRGLDFRQLVAMALWVGIPALLVAGWWFARGWLLYGSPLGLETHDATDWAITQPENVDRAWKRWWEVFRSLWIWLGWGTVRPDYNVYYLLFALFVVALAGLGLSVWRRRQAGKSLLTEGTAPLFLLTTFLLGSAIFLEVWMHRVVAPYGRLLYPALAAIVILLVMGWSTIHRYLPLIPIAFLMGLSVLAPTEVLRPAYSHPQPLSEAEVDALGPSLNLLFGPAPEEAFAELVHVSVLERSVQNGDLIPVRVCWRTLDAAERDYTVLVHIVGPQNSLIANRRTYPGLGAYPTSIWQPGIVFCDRVQVKLWEVQQIEPMVYNVEVAMLDQRTDERVPIFDANGNPWESAFLAKVHAWSEGKRDREPAALAEDGPPLQLVGSDVPEYTWRAGQPYAFTLRWAATTPVDRDYQVFVHLRDPQSGELVDQADGPPLGGWYPTSWWPIRETIVDERTFMLAEDVSPGEYELFVGFYDLASGQRFGDEYNLDTVTVEP